MKICIGLLLSLLSVSSVDAADVKVAFLSDPPGAIVYEDVRGVPKQWGYAPIILKYGVPRKWVECIHTNPMPVRWLSGAEANIEAVQLCPQVGKNQQFTFVRPIGVPGAEVDGQFALHLLQQPTPLALLLLQQPTPPPLQPLTPPPPAYVPRMIVPAPQPRQCTSTVIGTQIFTNCF